MPYPSYPVLDESEATRDAGIQATRASNGMLKVRRLFSADKTDFTVVHAMTRVDRDALMTFYAANSTAEFSFLWPGDGATYTVRFAAAPQISRRSNHYRATVRLLEV